MKHCYILFVCLLLSAVSCGPARHVQQAQEKAVVTDSSAIDSTRLRKTIETMVKESMSSALAAEMAEEIEVLHEVFTEPDSSGITHLKERTTTNYKSKSKANLSKSTAKDSTNQVKVSKDSVSVTDVKTDIQEVVTMEQEQRRIPRFISNLAWIGGLTLLMFIIWLLKKIRLI